MIPRPRVRDSCRINAAWQVGRPVRASCVTCVRTCVVCVCMHTGRQAYMCERACIRTGGRASRMQACVCIRTCGRVGVQVCVCVRVTGARAYVRQPYKKLEIPRRADEMDTPRARLRAFPIARAYVNSIYSPLPPIMQLCWIMLDYVAFMLV